MEFEVTEKMLVSYGYKTVTELNQMVLSDNCDCTELIRNLKGYTTLGKVGLAQQVMGLFLNRDKIITLIY